SSGSPFPTQNVLALITEGFSTSKRDRTPETFLKIVRTLYDVFRSSPANVGVFCASYTVLNSLRMYGIVEAARKARKKLFIEQSGLSASENSLLLEDYKSCGKEENGAVLLGVCGGRNSEGEDFPGTDMTTVVIVGIPYHLPTAKTDATIRYYDKVFHKKGWVYAYLAPSMQRANQASGRPIRKLDDKGAIIFMDERFADKQPWISAWLRNRVKTLPEYDLPRLKQVLKSFWHKF
ncbi:MAG: DNA repair helicase, partial [Candidatus Lokiarchaeota archaeon]|nr:DNA repair helicase [Candidatus Lokiarchaeota archaeon]